MEPRPLTLAGIRQALATGRATMAATRGTSFAYAAIFAAIGTAIVGLLLWHGFTPFVIAAAGAFMLVGPVLLAGFFGIAAAHEAGEAADFSSVARGFAAASSALWVLALVCALLFMIFVTDAAILYSYLVGGTPVGFADLASAAPGVRHFLLWGAVSGLFIALLLFCVSAFSVPLLCERRAGLVTAVVASVRAVFANLPLALLWAALLAASVIGSILLPPLLLPVLPWLAFASRALYRQTFPAP